MEFNWTAEDQAALATALGEAVPDRATLARTYIVMNDAGECLLIDPHPAGTWETWMFPYSSLILPVSELQVDFPEAAFLRLAGNSRLGDVSDALLQILDRYGNRYSEAVSDGINQVIPELVNRAGDVVSVDYSLKFSKTSDSYTAYRFEGVKILANPDELTLSVPAVWVSLDQVVQTPDGEKYSGKVFAGNVQDTLRALSV